MMPDVLMTFLMSLSPEDSAAVWAYLDECPNATDEMIEAVAPNAN